MVSGATNVIVVGSKNRQLEELLRAAGLKFAALAESELVALSKRDSVAGNPLLLDVRGESKLPAELPVFRQRHPSIGVVIVASTLEPGLMLEAMRLGVTEFLAEPVQRADLEAAISRVVTSQTAAPAGAVFAFLGAKGGVGSTTTAVNVKAGTINR